MKFTFDEKEYDSDSLSEQGKAILAKLQNIGARKNQLTDEFTDLQIVEKHYVESLKKELVEQKDPEIVSPKQEG